MTVTSRASAFCHSLSLGYDSNRFFHGIVPALYMIRSNSTPSEHHDDSNPQNLSSDLSQQSKQSLSPLDRVSNLSLRLPAYSPYCQQTLLYLLACCHSFDRPVLQVLTESASISDDDWHGITQLPFVDPVDGREDTFRLSNDARTELHQALWLADAEQWHMIHGVLADYFHGRSHTIVPPEASPKFKYQNEEWRSLTTEYLYHLILSERPGYQTIVISHLLEAETLDTPLCLKLSYQMSTISWTVSDVLSRVSKEFERGEFCPLSAETLAVCRDFQRFPSLHSAKQDDVQRIRQWCINHLDELVGLAKVAMLLLVAEYGPSSETLEWLNQAFFQAESCLFPDDPGLNRYMFGRQLAHAFYFDAKAYDKAIECHNRAVECNPDSSTAWCERGKTFSDLGRSEEAIASYDKAIECDVENVHAWHVRGHELYALGRVEEALDSYTHTNAHSPQSGLGDTWRSLAEFMQRRGRSEEALATYDNALEIKPEDAYIWAKKAEILHTLGRKEEAVVHYGKAAAYAPHNIRWLEKQGEILEDLGRHDEAKISYEQVVIACANAIASRSDSGVYGLLGKRGYFLSKLNRYEEAIASYDQAIEKRPKEAFYRKRKAWVLQTLGRKEEAIAVYEEALAYCDKNIEDDQGGYRIYRTWCDRADVLVKLKRYKEAIASYDSALEYQELLSYEVWLNRGQALAIMKRYEEAIASYDKALELNPNIFQTWYAKAVALRHLDRNEEAVTSYDNAIQHCPTQLKQYSLWSRRGDALVSLGRHEDALASQDKAIECWPDVSFAWMSRGEILETLGRQEEATASYISATQCSSEIPVSLVVQVQAFKKLGRGEEAIATLDKAIEVAPGHTNAWVQKGVLLMELKRYEEAIAIFDQVVKLEPDSSHKHHIDAIYNKACCFSRLGQLDNAIEQLTQAIQLKPNYRDSALKDDDLVALRDRPELQCSQYLP